MATSSTQTLIMGGGIGGLCLAHGLKKHEIPFHVFEKDRTESYRAQGYRIRLGGPAIPALRSLMDEKTFADFELSCADLRLAAMPEIDAQTARVDEPKQAEEPTDAVVEGAGAGPNKPVSYCVDRALIRHLPAENMSFDKSFSHYTKAPDSVTAYFSDGSIAESALLVAAGGKGSKPTAGERMSFVKDRSRDAPLAMTLEPITFSQQAERESRGLSCPHNYLFWVITAVPERLGFEGTGYQSLSLEESEQRALMVSEDWHPSLRTIIEHQQPGETSAFPITCVPMDFASKPWSFNHHITLLGDAILPMAPTRSGAVTAITDAQSLSEILATDGLSKTSINKYEFLMRESAGKVIPMS